MKNPCLGIIFLLLLCNKSEAQSDTMNRFCLSAGVGYFADITQYLDPGFNEPEYAKVNPEVLGKIYNGKSIWVRLGYNLNTGYIISGYYSMAAVSYKINDPMGLFWNEYLTDTYDIANLMFSKELGKKNNRYSLGLGILYRKYNHQDIDYLLTPVYNQDNELIDVIMGLPQPYNLKMNDLGLVFNFEYTYRFKNQLSIGVSCSTNLIFDIGFETVQISPLIGFVF